MPGAARVSVRSRRGSRGGFRQPRSWREALQDSQSRMRVTDPPCQTPSVMPATVRTLSGRGALDRARRNSQRQPRPRGHRAVVRRGFGEGFSDKAQRRCPAGRRIGSELPPAQHKSIAGGCLFPGARCHSAGPAPELRDAGVSRFSENGSHLAAADAGESHAGWVEGPGSSGNTGTGSHLAEVNAAEGLEGATGSK